MRYNIIETIVAGIVLVVAVGFLFFALDGERARAVSGYDLQASFAQVGGLRVGDDVRTAGMRIGRVKALAIEPDTLFSIVTFTIDGRIAVPVDSCVAINANGLLGGQHVGLTFGASDESFPPDSRLDDAVDAVVLLDEVGKAIYGSAGDVTTGC